MIDVYENCPIFENEKYILRFSNMDDTKELVNVYGIKMLCLFLIVTIAMVRIFITLMNRA